MISVHTVNRFPLSVRGIDLTNKQTSDKLKVAIEREARLTTQEFPGISMNENLPIEETYAGTKARAT